jgi:aldose sugar dehydrogenase
MTHRTRLQVEALEERRVPAVMLHPDLGVRAAATGLVAPTTMAFLGDNDLLVLEKISGKVQRVTNGALTGAVLDLPVNNHSQRGLLGITLHPQFATNHWAYLYWTESTTGADTSVPAATPLLGNRLDRFVWDGTQLVFDQTLLRIRAFQDDADAGPGPNGRHNGGPLAFGPDHKLYLIVGDAGRRGLLQNNALGPVPDDGFGGPEPDNAHFSSVIVRLNDDGSAPADNPFYAYGSQVGGEVGANLQKVFAYGLKNSFGLAFDPRTGNLWDSETGDDAFDEINRIEPGQNGGWIQFNGPVGRFAEFKAIESGQGTATPGQYAGLQQVRYGPDRIAATAQEALDRLYTLPGSHYRDPEFSWKFSIPPAAIGFADGPGLGPEFAGDLFVGGATARTLNGHLFRFHLSAARQGLAFDDPRLADQVADNAIKDDLTESESLLVGRDFGAITSILTGPNGNLFVLSASQGIVYEIYRLTPATVESVVVNDGSTQRSMVNRVTVTFDRLVTADAGAFELRRQDGSLVGLSVATSVVEGRTVSVLTFTGPDVLGGSLADGSYTLTVRADRVHDSLGRELDGDGDGTAGGDRVDSFFRLFGDSDGDGDVDGLDRDRFRSAFKTSAGDAGYLWYFDFDGDGAVDGRDNGQFNRRFGRH